MSRLYVFAAAATALLSCTDAADRPGAITAETAADLTFLREEEKLARDVYLSLGARWGLQVHENLSRSEQTHMDRVLATLEVYGLVDPVTDDAVGVLHDPALRGLYATLIAQGQESSLASLRVGATIEDLDLRDLDEMTARTADPYALEVYEALRCGSRNHLRAFYGQLAAAAVDYQAQYLTQAQLAAIVSTSRETCGR